MNLEEKRQHESLLNQAHQTYKKDLTRYSYYRLHNRTLSEDLVQDTFTKTWIYLMNGGKIRAIRSFLYRVLNNLIIDQYRKHKTVSLDAMIDEGFEPEANEVETPSTEADGKSLITLLKKLPERYGKVLFMRFVDNLSVKEIAALTGRSANCIAVQIHRGLKKLKSWYDSDQYAEILLGRV